MGADILIIGNGFDLAHGLETSYCDFLNFYQAPDFTEYTESLPIYRKCLQTNLWMKHFINRQNEMNGKNWIDLEQEIFEVIDILNRFKLENFFSSSSGYYLYSVDMNSSFIFKEINDFLRINTTVTFTLGQHIDKSFLEQRGYSLILSQPYPETFSIYIRDFDGFINFLYDQLREFTEAFQEYILRYVLVKPKKIEHKLILKNNDKERDTGKLFLLNFNYTNICEKLYGKTQFKRGFDIETIHMHGNISYPEGCNLVLGSKTFDDFTKNINPAYNVFQKHNQRHKYGTIYAYQDFYHKILSRIDENVQINFHVIGHSLDESDRKLLKLIFEVKKHSIIYIYYHKEEVQQNLINNITKIISENEVTSRVRLVKLDDSERGILHKTSGCFVEKRSLG